MKHTNTNEFKNAVKAYLAPIIMQRAEDYNETPERPFQWAVETAKAEVGFEFERRGEQGGLACWLSGLALNIAYTYYDIQQVAEVWHDCELTEKEAEKVCEGWFDFIALKILRFAEAEK